MSHQSFFTSLISRHLDLSPILIILFSSFLLKKKKRFFRIYLEFNFKSKKSKKKFFLFLTLIKVDF